MRRKPMRRGTASLVVMIGLALTAFALHTLVDAQERDGAPLGPRIFTSPISPIDPPSVIGGVVFDDVNGDGHKGVGEPGILGVTVKLRNGVSDTMTTPANGQYSFEVDRSGYYTVTAMTPSGYAATTPEQVLTQVTEPNQLVTIDFGYRSWSVFLPAVARSYP
jgi:hypothetical protein